MESECSANPTNPLFRLHFPTYADGTPRPPSPSPSPSSSSSSSAKNNPSPHPLLALGMLQWGTTPIDNSIINGPRGILTEPEAREIYKTFRSHGVVLFDTAEGYGGGTSEKRLGRLLQREQRKRIDDDEATVNTEITEDDAACVTANTQENIIIMTKFLPVPWRFTHAHFENALRASNKRLGISTTPIYLLHSPMHLWGRDIKYWVKSAAICKRKGFLETFGLSNCSAGEVKRAVEAGKKYGVTISANQVHYSLLDFNSNSLQEMHRTCNELGVAIIAYNTLGQGMLTDKFTKDKFAGNKPARMMKIAWDDLIPLRKALREVADAHSRTGDEKQVSMAQVAISWCTAKGTIPLVGCRSREQAEDTLASMSLLLTSEEVESLDALALNRCTLDGPAWRRKIFVVLAGVVMVTCRWLDLWGVGAERIQM